MGKYLIIIESSTLQVLIGVIINLILQYHNTAMRLYVTSTALVHSSNLYATEIPSDLKDIAAQFGKEVDGGFTGLEVQFHVLQGLATKFLHLWRRWRDVVGNQANLTSTYKPLGQVLRQGRGV
jgi:hypothetical protein